MLAESTLGDSSLAAYNPSISGNKQFRSRMLKPSHKNRRSFAIVMLLMVVWQCWFVAVEASEQFHLPAEQDSHHLAAHETASLPSCLNVGCSGHGLDAANSCDHCCACQGHGAHISIHTKAFGLAIAPPRSQPIAELPGFCSLYPATIYRPPIV